MSDPDDEQSRAEGLDEGVVRGDEVGDIGEDVVRAAFPPDQPTGVDRFGTTAAEEEGGESVRERADQEEPETTAPADRPVTGLLRPEDDPDEEVAELGDREAFPPAEEAAVHETAPPPDHARDSYLED